MFSRCLTSPAGRGLVVGCGWWWDALLCLAERHALLGPITSMTRRGHV